MLILEMPGFPTEPANLPRLCHSHGGHRRFHQKWVGVKVGRKTKIGEQASGPWHLGSRELVLGEEYGEERERAREKSYG